MKPQEIWSRILPFSLVFLAACILLFTDLGKFPLFNPDEALYAEPAREMLEIGDYITTYLNYVVRFTKPPLVIWAQALGILAFGTNEFAVRFVGAAAGAICVAVSYLFVERFVNRRAAVASGLMLATAPLLVGTAREAITDMPLSLFMASAMMAFYASYRTGSKVWLWTAWAMVGLSVMTKGPVGVVLPVVILLVFHTLSGDLKKTWAVYRPVAGGLIVGAITLPWFVTEIIITKGAYFYEFIVRENFQRYTSVLDSHKGGWYYHLGAMMGGFLPWSVFVPQAIATRFPWKSLVTAVKALKFREILAAFRPADERQSLWLFALVWASVTLVFFSTSVSKLIPYTLPAFPALAILVAIEFERIIEKRLLRSVVLPATLLALSLAGIVMAMPYIMVKLRDAPPELSGVLLSFFAFELVAASISLVLSSKKAYKAAFLTFVLATFSSYLFFGSRILTMVSNRWEEPLVAMARFVGASGETIFVYDMRKPSVPFYAGRQVIQPGDDETMLAELSRTERAYVLTKERKIEMLKQAGCKIMRVDGRFVLARYLKPEN